VIDGVFSSGTRCFITGNWIDPPAAGITLASTTSNCLVAGNHGATVTDNGTVNRGERPGARRRAIEPRAGAPRPFGAAARRPLHSNGGRAGKCANRDSLAPDLPVKFGDELFQQGNLLFALPPSGETRGSASSILASPAAIPASPSARGQGQRLGGHPETEAAEPEEHRPGIDRVQRGEMENVDLGDVEKNLSVHVSPPWGLPARCVASRLTLP